MWYWILLTTKKAIFGFCKCSRYVKKKKKTHTQTHIKSISHLCFAVKTSWRPRTNMGQRGLSTYLVKDEKHFCICCCVPPFKKKKPSCWQLFFVSWQRSTSSPTCWTWSGTTTAVKAFTMTSAPPCPIWRTPMKPHTWTPFEPPTLWVLLPFSNDHISSWGFCPQSHGSRSLSHD